MDQDREITAPLEADELQEAWEARAAGRPAMHAAVHFGAKTDLGQVRENNEDKFDFIEPDDPAVLATKGRVYAVADGMGGHSAGQIASEVGLKVFIRQYYSNLDSDVSRSLTRAVREANSYLIDVARAIPGRGGMGTTLTAAVVRDDDLFVAQVGDSRLYLLREGEIRQITEDHSWVAEHVRRGTMTPEEAESSPHRNVITRSLGGAPEVEPDIFALKIRPGDRYLLCSDGLSGMVPDAQLLEVGGTLSPSVAAWNLIELANEHGGKDNVTVFILQVVDIAPFPPDSGRTAAAETLLDGASPLDSDASEAFGTVGSPAPDGLSEPTAEDRRQTGFVRRLFGRGS